MLITLVVLSLATVKRETPAVPPSKLQCLNPVKGSAKLEPTNDAGTEKCIAVPDVSKKTEKVRK